MAGIRKPIVFDRGNEWRVTAVPILEDNFVYILSQRKAAVVIDAGSAAPVLSSIQEQNFHLHAVLLTHQHYDHTAGFDALSGQITPTDAEKNLHLEALALPGHTSDDVGYYSAFAKAVFTGDCLINGACGRALGGSVEDLYHSLQRILSLPGDTLVFGGHDYLQDNLRFALQVAPGNAAIEARLARYATDPAGALFVTLEEEKVTNLFLQAKDFASFAQLRKIKDQYYSGMQIDGLAR